MTAKSFFLAMACIELLLACSKEMSKENCGTVTGKTLHWVYVTYPNGEVKPVTDLNYKVGDKYCK